MLSCGYKTTTQNLVHKIQISYGDTPSCSLVEDLSACDEIRPGNYVFYDLMQYNIGSCSLEDIAVLMTCPVVAVHRDRSKAVIYGGAVHFGRDSILTEDGLESFGMTVDLSGENWRESAHPLLLNRLSQEHGVLYWPAERVFEHKPGEHYWSSASPFMYDGTVYGGITGLSAPVKQTTFQGCGINSYYPDRPE